MTSSHFSRRRFVSTGLAFVSTIELQRAAQALGFASNAEVCKLVPEQEQGPFYVADELLRSNIREDKPGLPLSIKLLVMDSRSCKPLANAAIDLWHCDAMGLYSGYTSSDAGGPGDTGGPGRDGGPPPDGFGPPPDGGEGGGPPQPKTTDKLTFLRGIQVTDSSGAVRFDTVFPGFYMGRTNHVHFKVRLGGHDGTSSEHHTYLAGHTAHTGQLFFPEEFAVELMKHDPYSSHRIHRTTQAEDMVYTGQHGEEVIAKLMQAKAGDASAGMVATLIVAVDPAATPAAIPIGGGGRGPRRRS